jgi:putative membrane protein
VTAEDEREPDYRMSLAAERTFLAYIRTGLALAAAGVAVAGALPDAGAKVLRQAVGFVLVLLGGSVLAFARPRWRAVTAAMRAGRPLPAVRFSAVLSVALTAVIVAAAVVVVLA